jgi:energy-coupling factor transport system substrate-specific component
MPTRLLALIPSAVAINLAMGFVSNQLGLPVYLDTLGTVLAAGLAGPVAGLLTGLVSQTVRSLYEGFVWFPFVSIQLLIALVAALARRTAGFATPARAIAWGVAAGVACGAASATISYTLFEGVTATGVTTITAILSALGIDRGTAVFVASITTDILDKVLVFLMAGVALRSLPRRLAARYR